MFNHDAVFHSTYRGVPIVKLPLDLWVYQELMTRLKTVHCVVEIGTFRGGSALALYDMMCAVNQTTENEVITIDVVAQVQSKLVLDHKYIRRLVGNAATLEMRQRVGIECIPWLGDHILVIDDGSHECAEVFSALQLYHSLVQPDGYYIVEDTICHHGMEVGPNPGPYEAVQEFLRTNHDFVTDLACEKFGLTYNPSGYLRRTQ